MPSPSASSDIATATAVRRIRRQLLLLLGARQRKGVHRIQGGKYLIKDDTILNKSARKIAFAVDDASRRCVSASPTEHFVDDNVVQNSLKTIAAGER
jgi:hypothetical protein